MTSHIDSRTNGISGFEEKLTWCRAEARAHRLAWDINGERSCGRPLGLRLKQNHVRSTCHLFWNYLCTA